MIKSIIQTLFIGLKKYVPKGKLTEYENEFWSRKTYNNKFAVKFFPKYIAFEKWAKKPKNKIDILLLNYWIYDVQEVGLKNTRLLKTYIKEYDKIIHKHAMVKLQAFKNVLERKTYLTEAHKKNSEAAMKQIAEWKKTPTPLNEILGKQKIREQQAKELEHEYLNDYHKKNSEAATKQLDEWQKSPLDFEMATKRQKAREVEAKRLESLDINPGGYE